MKKILFVMTLGILMFACGVKENPPDYVLPDIDDLLTQAWDKYKAGEFSSAYELFDSVITLAPKDARGYYGKGWSAIPLGKNDIAISSFSFVGVIKDISTEEFVLEKIPADDTSHVKIVDSATGKWILIPYSSSHSQPIVGYSRLVLFYTQAGSYLSLTPKHFSDTAFEFESKPFPSFDTSYVDTVILQYNIYAEPDSFPDIILYSMVGSVGSAFSSGDYLTAMKLAKELLKAHPADFQFEYYPYTTSRDVKLLWAIAAFESEFYKICVEILQELDPEWTPPSDPFNPDSWREILEEIEKLLQG